VHNIMYYDFGGICDLLSEVDGVVVILGLLVFLICYLARCNVSLNR